MDIQEYFQEWEKENNSFYPNECRWDRAKIHKFLRAYKDNNGTSLDHQLTEALKPVWELGWSTTIHPNSKNLSVVFMKPLELTRRTNGDTLTQCIEQFLMEVEG